MSTTYCRYPPSIGTAASVETVQGEGTAGVPTGGVLTVQGDPSGTPLPISGSITATNPSVSATGAAVPASATFVGGKNSGNLVALAVDSSGDAIIVGAGTAGTPSGGVVSVQGVASGTVLPANVSQFGGSAVVTGTGTGGSGIPRVTVSSDSTLTSVGTVTTVTTVSTVTSVTAIANALPAGSNTIGNVIPTASTAAVWQAEGNVAFGSVTNSYATILTPSAATKIVMLRNNTNAAISFSFDAGTTTNFILDAGDQVAIDYVANGLIASTSAIQIKYTVGAPTSGSVRVNACH